MKLGVANDVWETLDGIELAIRGYGKENYGKALSLFSTPVGILFQRGEVPIYQSSFFTVPFNYRTAYNRCILSLFEAN